MNIHQAFEKLAYFMTDFPNTEIKVDGNEKGEFEIQIFCKTKLSDTRYDLMKEQLYNDRDNPFD